MKTEIETKTPELKPSDSYIATKYDINKDGYIMLYVKDYKFIGNNKSIGEHRYNVELDTNRFLTSTQNVHHINEIRNDNRIENLMVFKNRCDHKHFHGIGKTEELRYNEIKCEWYYTDSSTPRYCKHCGKLLTGNKRFTADYCSKQCVRNSTTSLIKPSKENLLVLITMFHTAKAIAENLNTYPEAVRAWCNSYGISDMLTKQKQKSKCPSRDLFITKAKTCENEKELSRLLEVTHTTIKRWWNKFSLNGANFYCENKYKTNFLAKAKACKTDTELAKLLNNSNSNVYSYWRNSGLNKLDYYMK